MDPALVLLLRLRLWGWLRRMGRKLGTAKGLLLTAVGLMIFAPSILAVFLDPKPRGAAMQIEGFQRFGPVLLLVYCLSTLLFSPGDKAFAFSPAEISFLFPAPFTRRKLLAYKIGGNLALTLLMGIFMSFAFRQNTRFWPFGYVGLVLAFSFLQLFAMAVTLAGQAIGARASTRRRQLAVALIVVLVGATLVSVGWRSLAGLTPLEALKKLEATPAVQVALAPFRPFVLAISAGRLWPDFLLWAFVGFAINAALVAAILLLDTQYLEAAAASSERFYAKLERMRKGGPSVSSRNPNKKWKQVPALPWWGGVGPILWRQVTTAYRDFARVLVVPITMLVLAGVGIYVARGHFHLPLGGGDPDVVMGFAGIILGTVLVMSPIVSFDFRSDFERMEGLKTLPLSPLQVVMGQLATPAALICASQALAFAILAVATWPVAPLFWGIVAFAIPLNVIMLEVENLMFLWFPSRPMAHTPGDVQAMGRMMVIMIAKMLSLALITGVAAGLGLLAYLAGGWVAFVIVAWLGMMLSALLIMPLLGVAFQAFDVASDTVS